MAGNQWDEWFEREELIGHISDIRVQNLQVEREVVQKRTFTRWMNLHLEKCNPPVEVRDLFRDIQDGRILMALLEELSGCKLLHAFKPSSHRIFRLNNIAKVLAFLEERNVKLVSIDATDVADGNPSIVLGLIWNIILFFQIKELTGNIKSQFPSSSSLSSIPTSSDSDTSHSSPLDERKPSIGPRGHGKAIKTLLHWVQRRTRKYGVAVQDFGKSWTSGLAFLAVIKSIDPSLVDMRRALLRTARENIEDAFRTAHYSLGIPRLLEPEDVSMNPPDEQSIMTYVSQFLEHFPGIEEEDPSDILERSKASARVNETPVWNGLQRKREKPFSVKRDVGHPPPKIFISSVSEDHDLLTSPILPHTPEDKTWSNEGSPVASSTDPAEDKPFHPPLNFSKDQISTAASPQTPYSDSAINSPDSWSEVLSETAREDNSKQKAEDQKYESSVDVTSDLELPTSPENHSDRELFIDEGNYSLGSLDSLHAKSTMPSEEEDAYRYILDLKEQPNHDPNQDVKSRSEYGDVQETDIDHLNHQQAPEGLQCLERDSGFFHDTDEVKPSQSEDAGETGVRESESVEAVESSNADDSECLPQLSESVKAVESLNADDSECVPQLSESVELVESLKADDSECVLEDGHQDCPVPPGDFEEPDCPILQYEQVSISGSEEDVQLCIDLAEEHAEEHSEEHGCLSPAGLSEEVASDGDADFSRLEAQADPEEDLLCCYMCGVPVPKSSNDDLHIDGNCSESKRLSLPDTEEPDKNNPEEPDHTLRGNGAVSDLENATGETQAIHETLGDESRWENGSDDTGMNESHNANYESQAWISEGEEPKATETSEVTVQPVSEASVHQNGTISPMSSSSNQSSDGIYSQHSIIRPTSDTTSEDSGCSEGRSSELRLSLSVTPLLPAPSQRSDTDTDSEDTSEESMKIIAGSVHLEEQSPFDRHPGEWGALEPDSPADHDTVLTTSTDNTTTLRDRVASPASSTTLADHSQSKEQNGKTLEGKKTANFNMTKSSEGQTGVNPSHTRDPAFSDIPVLLVAWLLVYCLLVLPQMDPRMLSKLLFNTE